MKSSSTDITTKSRTYSLWHRLNVFSLICVKIFKNNSTKTYNMQMIFVCLRSYTSSIVDFSLAKCVCVCSNKKKTHGRGYCSTTTLGCHLADETGTTWRERNGGRLENVHTHQRTGFDDFFFFPDENYKNNLTKKFKSFFGRNKWLAG